MAATSAGFMKIPEQAESGKSVEMSSKQTSIPAVGAFADSENETFQHRPIEPGVLFLFGMGIIGIISIHRLNFQ
jgi:hypothetical protein